jgi:hypothetical protein
MNTTYMIVFSMVATLTTAAAQNIVNASSGTINYQPPCITTADADMTAGKTSLGTYFDHRTSNGTTYSQGCNPAFTVDITVPGSFNTPGIGNAITIGGGFDQLSQLTESNCKDASESVLIYKRTGAAFGPWSIWKLVTSQNRQGVWVPFVDMGVAPYCALSVPLRVVAPSATYLTDQYRVMVRPKLFGIPAQARVDWQWSY